ncbi:MAG TPA: DivIVA domain-containing protein [Acidothermaceae bacterium]
MPLLFGILVSAGVIFAIFAVTVGRGGSMTQFQPDWPGRPLPPDRPVRASDLADAKFSVAFRGYRMAEVDEALDRLAVEIAQRDERIQQLTGQPFDADPPAVTVVPAAGEPAAYESEAYDPALYRPDDTAVYQPVAPYDPNANPYAYEPNPYAPVPNDAGPYDPSVYQPPQPDPAPPVEPQAYQPHGYPPGVLDGGGHPTQPIAPVPDPSSADYGTEG